MVVVCVLVDKCDELFVSLKCELWVSSACGDGPGFNCTFDITARPIEDVVDTSLPDINTSPPGIRNSDNGNGLIRLLTDLFSDEEFGFCVRSAVVVSKKKLRKYDYLYIE